MPLALSLRDRAALVLRAVSGSSLPTSPGTVGGKLLAGIIQSGGQPPPRGIKETLAGYGSMPWLRAVVARISFDTAATDWLLYVKRKSAGKLLDPRGKAVLDGHVRKIQAAPYEQRKVLIKAALGAGDLEPVLSHPFIDLLAGFNPVHTGLSGRRVTQQHLDLVGEAFWLVERDGRKMPVALWPVAPSWILGTPTIAQPSYRVSFRGWQGLIPASEIIWFCDLDPANPYGRGVGTARALSDELETHEYASQHVKAFFYNRARPDLIVSPKLADGEAGMHEDEVRRLEEGWTARAGGFWRAFRPFFLRRPVEIKELDQSLRSQQFVQLMEFERNTILQVYGVSPEILGIVDGGSNRATISTAEYIYAKRVLVTRLELQRTVMQERLVPQFDERLILDYVSPVSRDREAELEAAKVMPEALSINEWRFRMGEDALEGDRGLVHLARPLLDRTDFSEPHDALDMPLRPMPALPGQAVDGEVAAQWLLER